LRPGWLAQYAAVRYGSVSVCVEMAVGLCGRLWRERSVGTSSKTWRWAAEWKEAFNLKWTSSSTTSEHSLLSLSSSSHLSHSSFYI